MRISRIRDKYRQKIIKAKYVEFLVFCGIDFFTSSNLFSFAVVPNLETNFSAILSQIKNWKQNNFNCLSVVTNIRLALSKNSDLASGHHMIDSDQQHRTFSLSTLLLNWSPVCTLKPIKLLIRLLPSFSAQWSATFPAYLLGLQYMWPNIIPKSCAIKSICFLYGKRVDLKPCLHGTN